MALPDILIILQSIFLLFLIVDPLGNVPVFYQVTRKIKKERKLSTTNNTIMTALVVLSFFAIFGNRIFDFFRVSFESFLIAGGILLFFVAFNMIRGDAKPLSGNPKNFGVVPLGIPLIAGPGAITMSMILSQTYGLPTAMISILVSTFLMWLTLHYCENIMKRVGTKSSETLSRVMGIMLAVISIQFVLNGIHGSF